MSPACAFVFSISGNLSKHLKRLLVCINLHEAVVKIQRRPILVKLSILQKSQMYKIMRSFVVFQNCFCRQVTVYVHILETFYYILKFQKQTWEAIYKRICQKKQGKIILKILVSIFWKSSLWSSSQKSYFLKYHQVAVSKS